MVKPVIQRQPRVVGVSANFKRPSKTHALVAQVLATITDRHGLPTTHLEFSDIAPALGSTFEHAQVQGDLKAFLEQIEAADILVVGTPVYKGAYSGMFKHLFDLIDPLSLAGKPVILTATGGGERHALVVEQCLRPLFGFFTAHAMPTAIYAGGWDFDGDLLTHKATLDRIIAAVDQLGPLLPQIAGTPSG